MYLLYYGRNLESKKKAVGILAYVRSIRLYSASRIFGGIFELLFDFCLSNEKKNLQRSWFIFSAEMFLPAIIMHELRFTADEVRQLTTARLWHPFNLAALRSAIIALPERGVRGS